MDSAVRIISNPRQDRLRGNMGYANIKGQEASALDFFEKRLQQTVDPEERRELTVLVERLRRELDRPNEPVVSPAEQNGLSNAVA
jgi:hypothetical protein